MEEVYKAKLLETFYDAEKDGYWLNIKGGQSHFFPNGTLEDFVNLESNEFFDKINNFDNLIFPDAQKNGISAYNIKIALEETKRIEEERYRRFLEEL